ncbi:MAG TPA: hypothetical protein PLW81_00965 [Thiobacillaceae bacterium]|nr:hypothetical protein [Thiobacillaceae bacterium]
MFEQAMTLLLSGQFICAVSQPDAYRFLQDEANRKEVEAFLNRLGRRLVSTKHGSAWYVAFNRLDPEQRKGIREEYVEIKHNLRLVVGFFVHVMQALGREEFLAPGSVIETHRLIAAIDENASLRNELQTLVNLGKASSDGTLRSALERLLKKMRDEGYLVLANPEREIYAVTGKVEYLQEVVDFLMVHESVQEDVEETPETGSLL